MSLEDACCAEESISTAEITGLLLAGGLGRRMDGWDKGLLDFKGHPMAWWALESLRTQVAHVLINANRSLNIWQGFGYPVINDLISGFPGPLAGVHAGLAACTTPWLATVPCDTPFLPGDLIKRLAAAIKTEGSDLAVVSTEGRLQPVFMLIRTRLKDDLENYLRNNGKKVEHWISTVCHATVDFENGKRFMNINTQEELGNALLHRPERGGS